MTLTMQDGTTFVAATPAGVVRQMKRANWGASPRKREYMAEVAERLTYLATVRHGNALAFLVDLEKAGIATASALTPAQARAWSEAMSG